MNHAIVPDMLFINSIDKKTKNPGFRLMSVYQKEFQEMIDDQKAIKVEYNLLCQCTRELLDSVEKQIAFEERCKRTSSIITKIEELESWRKKLAAFVALID